MNAGDFNRGLRAVSALFAELEILLQPYWMTSLEPSEEFKQVAYAGDVSYTEVYLKGLETRAYNFLLSDFGYLQFYRSEDAHRVDLRYAYYPNPFFTVGYEQFRHEYANDDAEGDLYELYLQFLEESRSLSRAPALRYDLALRDYRELVHPASHFHLGLHEDNRWPVHRILSPEAFALIVAKQFYIHPWLQHAGSNPPAGELAELERRLCVARERCVLLADDNFSPTEKRQFHIA
jgi:hypothetical protein